jgi:hypothetical protein
MEEVVMNFVVFCMSIGRDIFVYFEIFVAKRRAIRLVPREGRLVVE